MKTATVRELENISTELLGWIEAGEEIALSHGGKIIAWVVPEPEKPVVTGTVDWTTSAAFTMDRSDMPMLSAEQVTELLDENKGKW